MDASHKIDAIMKWEVNHNGTCSYSFNSPAASALFESLCSLCVQNCTSIKDCRHMQMNLLTHLPDG